MHAWRRTSKGYGAELHQESNVKTLNRLKKERRAFDMVDVDGMGNIHPQVGLSLDITQKGYLWVTTAEFMLVKRNWHRLQMEERYGKEVLELYSWGKGDPGKRKERRLAFKDIALAKFVTDGKKKSKEMRLVHYAMGETALRALFSINKSPPDALLRELENRKQYFGPVSR